MFGLSSGAAPDRFLVGLAVLSLLSEVAEERALLCVLDDAQWLDQASALTLAFVARRLQADPVGIVFSAREPGEELRNLPQLEVKGLVNGDARALLGSAVMFKLDVQVRDRIVAETRGNPLALLELPQGLTATQLAGGFGLLDAQGLPERIEESFVRRLGRLPEDTRRLLAARGRGAARGSALLWRAAETPRHRRERPRRRRTDGSAVDRPAGDIPPSVGAVGGVSLGDSGAAPGGPPRVGRSDRQGRRSRSPRVASG